MADVESVVETVLGNGLRVVVAPDRRIPIVTVCVWYQVGARDEPAGRTGLAHLFEHLMFQGSLNVGPNEHAEYVQNAGGTANGDTTLDATVFVQTLPSHHVEPVLWLEADRMTSVRATITRERLDNQRLVVINERRQRYDSNPVALAWEEMMRLAHPEGHPYQHMPAGRVADLESITLDDARRFAGSHYAPNNAVLVVVGDVDGEQVISWAERYFADIPPGGVAYRPAQLPPHLPPVPDDDGDEMPGPQPMLLAAYRLPPQSHVDADATALAISVLGAGRRGRLRRRLVEEHPIASGVTLGMFELARFPSLAMLEARVSVRADLPQVEDAVQEVLDALAADGPTELEVTQARQRLRRRVMERMSTTEGRAIELGHRAALLGEAQQNADLLSQLDGVTAEQVGAAAAEYLRPDNRVSLTLAGPAQPANERRSGVMV